jgi:hypothetical protein
MSKNQFGSFIIGNTVFFEDKEVIIVDKQKGNKTKKLNRQGGFKTGFKSNPCLYTLNNGYIVRGDKLKRIK